MLYSWVENSRSLVQIGLGHWHTLISSSLCQHEMSSKPLQITGAQSLCCSVVPSHAISQTQA